MGRRLRERDRGFIDLQAADLRSVNFNGLNFDCASFIGAKLSVADLRDASFLGARFDGCDARGVMVDEQTEIDELALAGLTQGGAKATEGLLKKVRERRGKEGK